MLNAFYETTIPTGNQEPPPPVEAAVCATMGAWPPRLLADDDKSVFLEILADVCTTMLADSWFHEAVRLLAVVILEKSPTAGSANKPEKAIPPALCVAATELACRSWSL